MIIQNWGKDQSPVQAVLLPELDPYFNCIGDGRVGEILWALMGNCEQIVECREQEEDDISIWVQSGQVSAPSPWSQ